MKHLRIPAILLACLAFGSSVQASHEKDSGWVQGYATVIDGDSIEIDGKLIRLFGIDAPELEQNCYTGNLIRDCGRDSASYLSDMIYGQVIRCRIEKTDAYGRILGSCIWNKRNINEVMVLSGQAVAWTRHSDLYRETEQKARAQRAGISPSSANVKPSPDLPPPWPMRGCDFSLDS
jgi:endonuclease YncB( thermonuclease family)